MVGFPTYLDDERDIRGDGKSRQNRDKQLFFSLHVHANMQGAILHHVSVLRMEWC